MLAGIPGEKNQKMQNSRATAIERKRIKETRIKSGGLLQRALGKNTGMGDRLAAIFGTLVFLVIHFDFIIFVSTIVVVVAIVIIVVIKVLL